MSRKFFAAILLIIALGITACGQIQLPSSLPQLPQLPTALQPDAVPDPALGATPDAQKRTAPGIGPQAGRNPGKGAQAPAALLQVFHQIGWEAGVVARVSDDQIGLRTVKNGPDKIAISASTIYVIPGNPNATLSDIHVGDRIIADVPKTQTAASLVMSVPKDYDKDNLVLGVVQSNSNGLLTLRTPGSPDTLTTEATTQVIKVLRQGTALGGVSDLQNGVVVIAIGQSSSDEFTTQVVFALPKGVLELGKRLGGDRKNPAQPPVQTPGN
jgi:hypothetical protein